ncbi:hypothetical protein [Phenylobacterium sp.]|uniref:hypothetical protein n=1 Tax=Phenylobacterium sp. TaxID=1871053 RepID=UPI002E33307B|nr:hypothetical protein [Phenylobacterium sp.]HEX4709443.1 hypothetical protein [Phenylobacterium sp.]
MKDFIDLEGASGALYRFRLWREGAAHLPMAGNYVFVRPEDESVKVLAVGECNDLSQVLSRWSNGTRRGATHAFTRLNVSRGVRMAEFEDLAANHKAARLSENAG